MELNEQLGGEDDIVASKMRQVRKSLTTAPTGTPKNFAEQFAFQDNGTKSLWAYINNVWTQFASGGATGGFSKVSSGTFSIAVVAASSPSTVKDIFDLAGDTNSYYRLILSNVRENTGTASWRIGLRMNGDNLLHYGSKQIYLPDTSAVVTGTNDQSKSYMYLGPNEVGMGIEGLT